MKTDKEIVEEFLSATRSQMPHVVWDEKNECDLVIGDWLLTTLKAVREESYKKGYTAGQSSMYPTMDGMLDLTPPNN